MTIGDAQIGVWFFQSIGQEYAAAILQLYPPGWIVGTSMGAR